MRFRITYGRYSDLAADVHQMVHGGILVRVADVTGAELDAPAELELLLPDGTVLESRGKVLQVLAGHGIAITVERHVVDEVRRHASLGVDRPGAAAVRHERIDRAEQVSRAGHVGHVAQRVDEVAAYTSRPAPDEPMSAPRAQTEELTHAQKIQLALHGNRDQRNAILRDRNRTLHAYVLKNPQITVEDVLAIAKNPQMGPDVFKQIAERADWLQRPQIALALVRNPKVPPEIGLRALPFVAPDALRQLAKGVGAPPHIVAAARKRVLR